MPLGIPLDEEDCTTSGSHSICPRVHEILDEAFEIAGMDPSAIGTGHITSSFRSLKFMLNSEWSTIGIRQWMVQQGTQAMSVGLDSFTLPTGAIDVMGMVLRRNGRDTEMYQISRDEYLKIVDKNLQGRPDRYFVDRQASGVTVKFWQLGENTTDIIVYDYLRQIEDAGALRNSLQIPPIALNAMVLGLAFRLALKFAPERAAAIGALYRGPDPNRIGGALDQLRQEDRERSDIEIGMTMSYSPTRVR
jgi:hypothetical protein